MSNYEFNISGNTLHDNASIFKTFQEINLSGSDANIPQQIADLKARLPDGELKPAVEELDSAVKSGKKGRIAKTVKKYASDFATQTFSNLASAGLMAFINSFK